MTTPTLDARRGRVLAWLLACAVLLAGLALAAVPAGAADFGIADFDMQFLDQDGSASTQAGAHPYDVTTRLDFNTKAGPLFGEPLPVEDVRDIRVDLPPGFVGNPTAVPTCEESQLLLQFDNVTQCPATTQVGVIDVVDWTGHHFLPIFNVVPPPGVPGLFGFNVLGTVIHLVPEVRSDSDYGLTIAVRNVSQAVQLLSATITFWGVPADPSHDGQRGNCLDVFGSDTGNLCPSDAPRLPFLTNPTSCTAPGAGLPIGVRVDSWAGSSDSRTFSTHLPAPDEATQQGTDGCEVVPFHASMDVTPASTQAGAPSGYSFDLRVPQYENPAGIESAHLRKTAVRLPQGVRVSASSANGLAACTDAQVGIGSTADPTCPDASKLGTVAIDTPLLSAPLEGAVYLGQPLPGQLLRLFLVAKGSGVIVKLPGSVTPDATTGQLTATFDNTPQLPFSLLHLQFKDGPRAPLSNPSTCGTYTTTTDLTGWNGTSVTSSSSFTISRDGHGAACPPREFSPDFTAGTTNPVAGRYSPFTLTFARDDEDQELGAITADLPEGLLARIASVDLCSDAAAAAGTCGESSRVGSVSTAAGAGSHPYQLPGGVYMTGPYKGAPFGLSIVVPAIAGPFDLGTVVVRAAVFVDKHTTALRIVSDPLPTILQGIPLQLRSVTVSIDRDAFMFNPTSCAPTRVRGRIVSVEGRASDASARFQVGDCRALSFKPRMSLKVGGKGHVRRGVSTPLTVTLRQAARQANTASVSVVLPGTLNARLGVVRRACAQAEYDAGKCSSGARIGAASVRTPLLRDPLRGPVFFVKNAARALPDMVIQLHGQVDVDLVGKVKIASGKLSTRFDTIPDVPFSTFTLRLVSGRNGPLGAATGLCSAKGRAATAKLALIAQNGKRVSKSQRLRIAGCRNGRRAR